MSTVRQSSVATRPDGVGKAPGRSRQQRLAIVLCVALLMLASGCTSLRQWRKNGYKVGPDYAPPCGPVAQGWLDQNDPRVKPQPVDECAWWMVFNDPMLNNLIETAYRQNLDLRTAATRILEARSQRAIAVGNLFPQSQSAVGAYAHGQLSDNMALPLPPGSINLWATGFTASWELDFWGRYRRLIEASDADLGASVERYHEALVLLLSEVATSYVQMRTFEERLLFARTNVELQRGSRQLAEQRFNNGVATELDVRQARLSLAQTEAIIPPLEIGRRQAANRLCILLGMPVTNLTAQIRAGGIPGAPTDVAVGIPAELLRRRPDIRRAEREVASQSAQIGVAEADLYPRFALNGFLGYASNDLNTLVEPRSFLGFVVPNFQWNVLNYGRITNNVRVQEAKLQEVTYQYQQTVLNAGREVEDSLVGFLQSQQQAIKLTDAVREAGRSVELVVLQFKGGVTDFNRVYTTQSSMVTEQDQLATTRGNIAINLIDVYRSLGGGWQYFSPGHSAPVMVMPPLPGAVAPAPAPEEVQPQGAIERLPAPAPALAPPSN